MNNELNILLVRGLRNKASVTVAISELQRIAGDDWLLELSEQAQLLRALASPHPINKLLTIVTRNK